MFYSESFKSLRLFAGFLLSGLFTQLVLAQSPIITPNPLTPVRPGASWDRSAEPRVRLVTPRNSGATAPVVLPGMTRPVQARISDLRHEQGGPNFPSALIELRYGWDGLAPDAEAHDEGQVVWVTVNVPPNAPPGRYAGQLTLTPGGTVPVLLEIGTWVAPSPNDFGGWMSLLNSPASVARYYEVEKWSDEHFERLVPTLREMGRVGNHVLYITPVGRSHFGDEISMIRWTGGNNPQPEFSALDRYLDLWGQHIGPPRKVIVYLNESSWWGNRREVRVTTLNRPGAPGGEVTEWPPFSASGQAERWRAAVGGIVQRVRQRGWDDTEVLIGVVGDQRNFSEEMTAFFETAAPGLRWATFTHGRGDPRIPDERGTSHTLGGLDFAYVEFPYAPDNRQLTDTPLNRRPGRGPNSFPFITSFRGLPSANPTADDEPGLYFFMPLAAYNAPRRDYVGIGRLGMDFWETPNGGTLIGRFERWHNLYRGNPRWMLPPGPKGALASQHTEALRMGTTLAEAMRILHEALTDESANLSPDVKERGTKAYMAMYDLFHGIWSGGNNETQSRLGNIAREDWQSALRLVYDAAGEIAGEQPVTPAPIAAAPDGAAPGGAPPPEIRDWTSDQGTTIRGLFLGREGNIVTIRIEDGREIQVPANRLSEEDQAWLRARTQ
ncbi:MAG: hypothetical protein JJU29_14090 [Verrucomicrobia bacterium]|nr:hypothetical protein [Verrucomicrobiota bacterium]MCH8512183.1 hypothetical protein [Kiritimatiellia bacterium]